MHIRRRAFWCGGVRHPALAGCLTTYLVFAARDARASDPPAVVRVGSEEVVEIDAPRGDEPATARAQAATLAIQKALREADTAGTEADALAVRVRVDNERARLTVGDTLVLELGPADARDGDVTRRAHEVAEQLQAGIDDERLRRRVAGLVYAWSMVVFSGLIAFALVRVVHQLAGRGRDLLSQSDTTAALRFWSLELVPSWASRALLRVVIGGARVLGIVGLAYGWLVFAASRFQSSQPLAERLTALVVEPLAQLLARLVGVLPVVITGALALGVLGLLLRLVGVFFAELETGRAERQLLPREMARPVGSAVQVVMVAVAIGLGAPVVTGDVAGPLPRVGLLLFGVLGLACVPLAASAAVGLFMVVRRRLRPGDYVRAGALCGRVGELGLFDFRLFLDDGSSMRLWYLPLLRCGLEHLTRVTACEMVVRRDVDMVQICDEIEACARAVGFEVQVQPVAFERDHGRIRVGVDVADLHRVPELRRLVARTWRDAAAEPSRGS